MRLEDGITQSELTVLDDCKMKWNLSYNNLVTRRGGWNWPIEVGSAFHYFAESFYKSILNKSDCDPSVIVMDKPDEDVLQDSDFEQKMEYWTGVLGAMQRAYTKLYQNDLKLIEPEIIEQVIVREYRGYTFTAKIDLTGKSPQTRRLQMDHKTTSSINDIVEDGWDFRLQFNFYPWMLAETQMPDTFIINAIRRPALKQTKAELHRAFINRIANDINARPLDYFRRESVPINPAKIKHFQETVLDPKIDFINRAASYPELLVNKNTNHCRAYHTTCGFLPICRTSWEAEQFQFKIRDTKHVELVIE